MIDWVSQVRNKPSVDVRQFNFTPQAPGVTLTAGSNKRIDLSPVPLGLNSTDTDHYVRLSGGTGSAETCLINGGVAVAGSATGYITVQTVANSHSGAWTVASATAGLREAAVFISDTYEGSGTISIPSGSYQFYAKAVIPTDIYIYGDGVGATRLYANTTADDVIYLSGSVTGVCGLTIDSNVGGRSGSGIATSVSFTNVVRVDSVQVASQSVGISINCPGYLYNSICGPISGVGPNIAGVILNSNEIYVVETQSNSNTQYGYKILSGTGIYMTHAQAASNGISNFAIMGGATNIVISADRMLSSMSGSHGIDFTGSGLGLVVTLTNPYIELSGRLGLSTVADKAGFLSEVGALVQIVGGLSNGNTGPGILIGPSGGATTGLVISGMDIAGNGVSVSSAEDASGIKLAGSVARIAITGNVITGQRNALNLSAATIANGVCVTGNYGDFTGSPLYTSSPGNFNVIAKPLQLAPNYWSNTSLNTYASATALTIRPEDVTVIITGTTTVTSIVAEWLGRRVTFIKHDATGSVIIMGKTLIENGSLVLTFDGTNWY